MFNFTRYCASLSLAEYQVLPSGTSSNEALHKELNKNFSTKIQRYSTMLELGVRGFHLAKVLSHDRASTAHFTKQHNETVVLNRLVRHLQVFTDEEWAEGCKYYGSLGSASDKHDGHRKRSAELGLFTRASELAAEHRTWKSKQLLKQPGRYWLKFGVPTTRCNKKTRLVADPRKGLKGKKRTPFTAVRGTVKFLTKWGKPPKANRKG